MLECASLEEVRDCIDRIDDQIVRLIAERHEYVNMAMTFKKCPQDANVPSRNEEIVQRVRELAESYGIDPQITEGVYRAMIAEFVRIQQQRLGGA